MKKSLILLMGCALSAVVLTGCKTINTNDGAYATQYKSIPVEFESNIEVKEQKVEGKASMNVLFGFIAWGDTSFADEAFNTMTMPFSFTISPTTLTKQAATYNACEANKADALLGAKYKVKTLDYFVFKQIDCTATGYPGVIKGVKVK